MSHYFMNIVDGHIDGVRDVDVPTNEEALEAAEKLVTDRPIELWCGTRHVRRFETPSTSSAERCGAHQATEELVAS